MNFLCLIHANPERDATLSAAEKQQAGRDNAAYYDWLVANGHNVVSAPVKAPATATVLRTGDGQVSMTDGPFVETKEHLAGFMVIRARDRAEALAVAARAPVIRYGGAVEVREIDLAGEL